MDRKAARGNGAGPGAIYSLNHPMPEWHGLRPGPPGAGIADKREKHMRTVISISVIGLLIATAPAFAQQKSRADDRAMARAVAQQKMLVDLVNKGDAAGLAKAYAADGIFVDPAGAVAKGRAAIEKEQADTYKGWGNYTFTSTPKEAHAVGNGYWYTVDTTIEIKRPNGPIITHAHGLNVMMPEGKGWKIAITSVGLNVPPPGAMPQR